MNEREKALLAYGFGVGLKFVSRTPEAFVQPCKQLFADDARPLLDSVKLEADAELAAVFTHKGGGPLWNPPLQ